MENSAELLAYVTQVSRKMVLIRIPNALYAYIIDEVMALVGAEFGYLVVIDEFGQIEYKASRQSTEDNAGEYLIEQDGVSRSIVNVVLQTREPLVIGNATLDPRFADANSVLDYQLRSVMCVPLIVQEKIIGAIYVENRSMQSRFSKGDIEPLWVLANQAAVSVENAQLHEFMEERVKERTEELEALNQRMALMMGQLVEAKKAADLTNELLESRVKERTMRLEQAIKRSEDHKAEKEKFFNTMIQQSEQVRQLTQLFLQNQNRQQGLTLTIQNQVKEKLNLLQSSIKMMWELVDVGGNDQAETSLMTNHLYQMDSVVASLQDQSASVTTTLDQVAAENQSFGQNPLINLSSREREVLNYFVLGKSRSEIAQLLVISPGTVSTYRKRIYQKLNVSDHAGLMKLAIYHNLIEYREI